MKTDEFAKPGSLASKLTGVVPDLEMLYKDIHSHPELSLQETRTAAIAAGRLRAAGYEVATEIGKTGV
ncbi:MAG TPA: amidohydrolase, partial [Verrucomicrobiae bacterium]|nr:amidohydrolase [Verrucomicrobiae bacterium]